MSPTSTPSRRSPARRLVSLAVASALATATLPVLAAPDAAAEADVSVLTDTGTDAGGADRATRLEGVEVDGEAIERPANIKYTEPLRDTPQTITVVDRQTLDEQNLLSLRDILSTLPGITFGAGEGGGGYGDSINLRGFSANADITVDGVRDSAQYSRTDSFNLEALELVNGANSVFSGAGSVGGNINLVSKAAHLEEFNLVSFGVGTDAYGRATADSNMILGESTALRLNAMVHQNDVPGRDVENYERWGFAPSLGLALDSETRFTVSAVVQHDENTPQYGVPYFAAQGGQLPGTDIEAYYGYSNIDRQEIDAQTVTGVFEHDFSADVMLRSLARWQHVDQLTIVNAPQGTFCMENGINPATGLACAPTSPTSPSPGGYIPSGGPRGNLRDTENELAISQTDLTADFDTGAVAHALVAGVSFTRETFELDTGNVQRNADGTTPIFPEMDLADPYHVYEGPANYIRSAKTRGTLSNQAVYVFDTLKFNEQWHLNLGARWEHNEGDTRTTSYAPPYLGGAITEGAPLENEENLFSWRAGVVFKPVEAGTIYLSFSDSSTPSKASVNGACIETATNSTCNVDPETATNIELGTKWDVIDGRLALTAALFRNERENYKVVSPDPLLGYEQQLDGRARVDGLALGVAGRITDNWSIFANATFLDSEILNNVSDFCLANPGPANGCNNTPTNLNPDVGRSIAGTPDESVGLWTTYDLGGGWLVGYGVNYQSEFRVVGEYETDDWTTHRAMVAWEVNDMLSLQLNANNLFDEDYFTRVRTNAAGWATPGDARSFTLTANLQF